MNAPTPRTQPLSGAESDPLMDLEAKIARRVDEIAATHTLHTPLNLFCWLQAEQEVLAKMNLLGRWHANDPAQKAS